MGAAVTDRERANEAFAKARDENPIWAKGYTADSWFYLGWKDGTQDALERARISVLEQRCERGTPWDLAIMAAAEAIRALMKEGE
jgi:hypothetical protein